MRHGSQGIAPPALPARLRAELPPVSRTEVHLPENQACLAWAISEMYLSMATSSFARNGAQGSLILLTPDLLWRRWFLAESRTRLSGNV